MAGILIATGFVRIDSDTSPAMKAIKGLGSLGASALSTTLLPVTAAVANGVGAMTASLASAGVAAGAFAAAVGPQFKKITEASQKLQVAEDAEAKATIAKAHAQRLAKDMGVKYGTQIKITSKMSGEAKAKAQAYNRALGEVTTSTNAARRSQAVYDEKLKAMTPATRETAKAYEALKDDVDRWSDSLSATTMPMFTAGIEKLRDLLPRLSPFVRTASTEIREFASGFGEGQAGRVFKEFGSNLQANAGSALGNLLTVIRNVTVGVVGMINAFMPVQSGMSGGLAELTQRFADFGAGLGQSEGFATFLERARGAVPAIKDFASALGDIISAAGPMSGFGLLMLQIFAQIISAIPTPVLKLLVPAILAVNAGMKLYAIYQAAATAATWLFTTSVTASTGVVYTSRAVLAVHRVQLMATAVASRAAAAATWLQTIAMRAARMAMLAFRYALVAVRLAVVLTTTAFRVLAVAMISNPIGLVVAAIALLVGAFILAYKKSETFRNIVHGAMDGVKNAAMAVGRWFAGPFVNFFKAAWDLVYKWYIRPIVWYWTVAVPNAAKFLWGLVVRYFNLMMSGVRFVWDTYQKVILRPFLWFYTKAVPGAAKYLWSKVVGAFRQLVSGVAAAYNLVRNRVFSPIGAFFTKTIPGWAGSLRNRVTGAWSGLRNGLTGVYSSIRNRVFSPIGAFFTKTIPGWARTLRDRVKGYFREMREGIGSIWAGIRSKTKTPVNWVLDHVWNRGLVNIWGKITSWIGIKNKLKPVKLLAAGGTVGRAQPGVFNKPTAIVGEGNPRYPEYVIPTDPRYATRARGLWHAAGAHFMEDGGILGSIKGAIGSAISTGASVGKAALSFLSDPVDKAKDLLMSPLKGIAKAIGSSSWARMAARLPRMAVDGLIDAVKSVGSDLLGLGGDGGGGSVNIGGSGVKRWTGVVRQALGLVGQPAAYTGITLRRMNQESGGNPTIVNKWDSNWKAGYPSVGLMQVIRPTFQSHAGRFRRTGPFSYGVSVNPLANVYASMRYALAAYGSLPRAYNRAGGYALGTDGASSGWHWTGELGPELMKLPAGTKIRSHRASVRQATSAATASVVHLTVENHGVIGSRQQVLDWLVESLSQLERRNRLPRARGGAG